MLGEYGSTKRKKKKEGGGVENGGKSEKGGSFDTGCNILDKGGGEKKM